MDAKNIISGLKAGLEAVDKLSPLAALLGPQAAAIAKIVDGVGDIAKVALERADDLNVAFTSEDQEEIKAINKKLADLNDDLAGKIAST